MSFEELCRKSGFYPFTPETKIKLSSYLGLSVRQIERYINGLTVHPCCIKLLEIRSSGLIDLPDWCGFHIRHNSLVNPNGEQWDINELKSKSLFIQTR